MSPTSIQRRCLVVLGMHRGGTSALAGTLRLLGVDFGDDLLPGQVENPLGFFEHRAVVRINDAILEAAGSSWCDPLPGWSASERARLTRRPLADATRRLRKQFGGTVLWGLKDPRLCRLLAPWEKVFARINSTPSYVFVVRHPMEVAASLGARNRMEAKNAQLLWLEHLLAAEAATRGRPRVFVTYDVLMADWRVAVDRIGAALDIAWPHGPEKQEVGSEIDRFLRPALRHHRQEGREAAATLRPAAEVYALLRRLAEPSGGDAGVAAPILAALDAHRQRAAEWTWLHTDENVRLRRERHEAQKIIEAYEVEIGQLRADRDAVLTDRRKAQEVIEAVEAREAQARGDCARLQAAVDARAAELEEMRAAVAALGADRTEAQRVIETLAAELDGKHRDFAALQSDRQDAQAIMESLTGKLAQHATHFGEI